MKKTLSFLLAILMLLCVGVSVSADDGSPFSDVKTSRWSYEAINYAVEQGYMNGVGNGKFDPAGSMTRGMVVTVLYRREGSPTVTFRNDFTDVKAGKYYSDAVIWAKDEGVVNGITETTFEPNGKITREQLATMLSRFSERCLVSVPERADLSGYPDADRIHSYARDALAWANEANLIKGMSDGTLSPRGNATREQFATILQRFDDTFNLVYNEPVIRSHYTEKPYPLVEDADVYVAVNGDDNNPGTFETPLATFAGAVAKVREIKQTKTSGDIVVAFKAGDYGPLSVTLTSEDSGTPEQRIVYCKYGDGDVTFNNGYDIPKEDFAPVSDEEKALFRQAFADKIYVADARGKLGGYDPSDIVLSDSGLMTLARFPNRYTDGTDNLIEDSAITTSLSTMKLLHTQFLRRMSSYHTLDGLRIYGFLTTGWYKEMLTVGSYDFDTHEMCISDYMNARSAYWTGGLRYELQDDGTYFIWDAIDMCFCNMSEDLDAPGEYWVDTEAEKIYVYGEPDNCHLLGGEGSMITAAGNCVTFRGLGLRNSSGKMIDAYGDGISVEGCAFTGCNSEHAVHVDIPDNANASGPAAGTTVRDCEFSNCAGNGLYIEGCRSNLNLYRGEANVTVDNCFFTECNLSVSNTGALHLRTSGAMVTHNEFYSTSWEGIDYRGTSFMTAKYNVFDRVCYNGDDTGVVNSWDFPVTIGNVVSNNLFHAGVGGMVGRYCAYLDNSTGTEFCSNIMYNCGHGVMSNGNRDNYVHDNVIINTDDSSTPIEVRDGATLKTEEAGRTGDFSEVLADRNYIEWKAFVERIAADPGLRAVLAEKAPHLLTYTADVSRWEEPEFVLNVVASVTGNRYFNKNGLSQDYSDALMKFGEYGNNAGYTLGENPLFVNPALGDYRIREGTGFPDIEFEQIGRY